MLELRKSDVEPEARRVPDQMRLGRFCTKSPVMAEVLAKVASVAPTKATVLISGETGTGKSLLARLIHAQSNRAHGPFVPVHCGSIPENLVESELFGHEKGAFTGAVRGRRGRFQAAAGGTIFLDEVATMTAGVQVKLLEVLQEHRFTRVGGEDPVLADARVVAASNVDLHRLSDEGGFRRDLFFRLNVFPIELPPLRERREDIALLAREFLARLNRMHGKEVKGIDQRVMAGLMAHDWPGNIRELENLMERAYILEKTRVLGPDSWPAEMMVGEGGRIPTSKAAPTLSEIRKRAVEEAELSYLSGILKQNRGSIQDSASAAGISTRQLHNQMSKYGLRKEDFR